jgi:hypothetical protein
LGVKHYLTFGKVFQKPSFDPSIWGSHLFKYMERPLIAREMIIMNVERTFNGNESFISLLMPLIDAEIDRIMEQQSDLQYNDGNANASHSEEVA